VGATRGKNAVHWQVVREILIAWIIAIPITFARAFTRYIVVAHLIPLFG